MTEKERDTLIGNLQSAIDTQSRIALRLDTEGNIGRTLYGKQDIVNATIIFNHVLSNISAGHCFNELCLDKHQAGLIAEEMGKNIRQTILLATGIDMHTVFDNE